MESPQWLSNFQTGAKTVVQKCLIFVTSHTLSQLVAIPVAEAFCRNPFTAAVCSAWCRRRCVQFFHPREILVGPCYPFAVPVTCLQVRRDGGRLLRGVPLEVHIVARVLPISLWFASFHCFPCVRDLLQECHHGGRVFRRVPPEVSTAAGLLPSLHRHIQLPAAQGAGNVVCRGATARAQRSIRPCIRLLALLTV